MTAPMTTPRLASFTVTLLLATLAACAAKPTTTSAKPAIRSIAVVPATEPLGLGLENKNGVSLLFPIAAAAFWADSQSKVNRFNQVMAQQPMALGNRCTLSVVEALRSAGYRVTVLDSVVRPEGEPDRVDVEAVETDADAVLQLRITRAGLYSGAMSGNYLPRVNIQGTLYAKSLGAYPYDEEIYYGVDAREGKGWAVVADKNIYYPSFDSVVARAADVSAVLERGAEAAGARLAARLKAALQ